MPTDSQLIHQMAGQMVTLLKGYEHFQTEIMRLQTQKIDVHEVEKILADSLLVKQGIATLLDKHDGRLRTLEKALWAVAGIGFLVNTGLFLWLIKVITNS